MHNLFHLLLLKQDTTRRRQVDKNIRQIDFDVDNENKNNKVEAI